MSLPAVNSLELLAEYVRATTDEDVRWRLLLAFLDEARYAEHGVASLIVTEPGAIGGRWDAMIAAVAEHLAYSADIPAPDWVRGSSREWLGRIWWVSPLPSARPWALAHSPAAFRRRGIFLHPDDLAVA